jgi:hypothetical protein
VFTAIGYFRNSFLVTVAGLGGAPFLYLEVLDTWRTARSTRSSH